jgi:hypothetical protein
LRTAFFLTAAFLTLSTAPPLAAQSWLPLDGETILSFSFHATNYEGHRLSNGDKEEFLPSYSRVALVNIDYGITNRLAFTARIPYVFTRNGPDPSPIWGNTGLDDGFWHGNLQDYAFKLRYAAMVVPVAMTPFVLYSIPSHSYETQYEAAPGRGLQELIVGTDFGGLLRPLTSRGFFEARLSYAFVEELAGVSTDRLNGGLALGYFVTPTVSAIVNGSFQNTYGGLTIDYVFGPDVTPEEFLEHDGLLEDDHWRGGFGVAWSFRPRWRTSAFWSTIIDGTDAHYGDSYTITVSRSF